MCILCDIGHFDNFNRRRFYQAFLRHYLNTFNNHWFLEERKNNHAVNEGKNDKSQIKVHTSE